MENIVRFSHCGKLIYTFTHREESLSPAGGPGGTRSGPAGGPGGRCPLCGVRPGFRLLDAPVAVSCPFSNGHETPRAFLISSRSGPTSISEQNESELHVGISNSEGVVFSYTESGVQRQQQGWEKSLTIPLVTPSNHSSSALITPSNHLSAALVTPSNHPTAAVVTPRNHPSPAMVTPSNHPSPPLLPGSIVRSWDRRLETFSSQDRWTTDRFSEEGEFGSCCYGFALSFINEVRRSEVMEVISQNTFTHRYVLPTIHCSSKYLSLQMVCQDVPEQCPLCGERVLGCRLQEAPVSLPSPFCNGHTTSCCFLLAPGQDNTHRDFDGKSELHTGISDTKGVVYNYTHLGVVREQSGWERCIRVVLVQQDSFSLRDQWDKYLESYSGGAQWDPAWTRFDEVTHNCYSYCLGFINRVLEVEGRGPLTREQFTERYVLPRTTRAARYTGLLQVLKTKPYYLLEKQTGKETDSLAERETGSLVERETG